MAKTTSRSRSLPAALVMKLLTPLLASAASAAATYAARRAPDLFEEMVAPRLRELGRASAREAGKLPSRAESLVGGGGDLADGLTERVQSIAEGVTGRSRPEPSSSAEQRERERAARAARREARRRALG
jgi:hypothetical protein